MKQPDACGEKIIGYLDSKDVKLYTHQAETYEAIRNGKNVISQHRLLPGKLWHLICRLWKQ